MSEQGCHDYRERTLFDGSKQKAWYCFKEGQDWGWILNVGDAYCPICGTKLNADGTTQARGPVERGFWLDSEVVETLGKEYQPGEPTADELLDALGQYVKCWNTRYTQVDGGPETVKWLWMGTGEQFDNPRDLARAIIAAKQAAGEPTTDAASRTAESE